MALWREINNRPEYKTKVIEYYNNFHLSEFRIFFDRWIEDVIISNNINEEAFLKQLERNLENFIDRSYYINLQPIDIYNRLKSGVEMELDLLKTLPIEKKKLQTILSNTNQLNQSIITFINNSEQLNLLFNNLNTQQPMQQSNLVMNEFEQNYNSLYQVETTLISELSSIFHEYQTIQNYIINQELKGWQKNQAYAGNGGYLIDNLDAIQICIELLVKIICNIIGGIEQLILLKNQNTSDRNANSLTEILRHARISQKHLICSAFIIEKQPPQVMKKNIKFSVTVRWLIGQQLNTNTISRPVRCFMLSESQAKLYCRQGQMAEAPTESSGQILPKDCLLEYNRQTNHFSANFRNMQLTNIRRPERRGTECVMDEKFALLFHISVNLSANCEIRVWTISLPVVAIVHGNQEPHSLATITWDNASANNYREPFDVPDQISWDLLSEALCTKFRSSTGRSLNDEHMHFLHEKLFHNESINNNNDFITWAQFCKDPMPNRSFTFWEWFFAAMKLMKEEHLQNLWKAGLIFGFINKNISESMLKLCSPGTFLIRFSDSELGRITLAFVDANSKVYFVQPWSAKDLVALGLADRLRDAAYLTYLYPNIPKNTAFGNFYTVPPIKPSGGYVSNFIMNVIEVPNTNTTNMQFATEQQQCKWLDIQNNQYKVICDPMVIDELLNSTIPFFNQDCM